MQDISDLPKVFSSVILAIIASLFFWGCQKADRDDSAAVHRYDFFQKSEEQIVISAMDGIASPEIPSAKNIGFVTNDTSFLNASVDNSFHSANCMTLQFSAPKSPLPKHCKRTLKSLADIVLYSDHWVFEAGQQYRVSLAATDFETNTAINRIRITHSHAGKQTVIATALSTADVTVQYEPCRLFFGEGCDFDQGFSIKLPVDLSAGVYKLDVGYQSEAGDFDLKGDLEFFVNSPLKRDADFALIIPDWTGWAYTTYGGGSLYQVIDEQGDFRSLEAIDKKARVSSSRPYSDSLIHSPSVYGKAIEMLQSQSHDFLICSMTSLHTSNCNLDQTNMMVLIGHNEYWTKETWDMTDRFIERGGNIVNFSGNIDWWEGKFINGEFIVDKDVRKKTQAGTNWEGTGMSSKSLRYHANNGPERPPSKLFGVSFRVAGFPLNRVDRSLNPNSKYLMSTKICEHPVFDGILRQGEVPFLSELGGVSGSVEMDGVLLDENGEIAKDSHYFREGSKLRILSTAFARRSNKLPINHIGYFVEYAPYSDNGGTVLTLGSAGAVRQMDDADTEISQLLNNSIKYINSGNSISASTCDWYNF